MALLHLKSLPPRTKKGTIVRLLVQVGEIDRQRIGAIQLRGRAATVEVPDKWSARLVKVLYAARTDLGVMRDAKSLAFCSSFGEPEK